MTDELKLQTNEYLPLRDVVFETLRAAILKGDFKPGERLMEQQLAEKLGVSRTPIREAIRMLEQEGLAVTTPRKGAEVAKMTLKGMEDVLEIRSVLDDLAVRLAADRITEEQLEELRREKDRFEVATASGDVKTLAEADVRFHDIIYEATSNPKLINLLYNLREQLYRYRVEYLKDSKNYPNLIHEHKEIVESLEARDRKRVMAVMREHVENQAAAVREVICRQNEKEQKKE